MQEVLASYVLYIAVYIRRPRPPRLSLSPFPPPYRTFVFCISDSVSGLKIGPARGQRGCGGAAPLVRYNVCLPSAMAWASSLPPAGGHRAASSGPVPRSALQTRVPGPSPSLPGGHTPPAGSTLRLAGRLRRPPSVLLRGPVAALSSYRP